MLFTAYPSLLYLMLHNWLCLLTRPLTELLSLVVRRYLLAAHCSSLAVQILKSWYAYLFALPYSTLLHLALTYLPSSLTCPR